MNVRSVAVILWVPLVLACPGRTQLLGEEIPQALPISGVENIAVGDMNGDGRPDVVVSSGFGTGGTHVLFGDGAGDYSTSLQVSDSIRGDLAIADLNGDRIPDIAIGGLRANVFLSDGAGGFLPAKMLGPVGCNQVAIADVTSDGYPDVVTGGFSDTVHVVPGHGNGGFWPSTALVFNVPVHDLTIGDINGDGLPDLAVSGAENPSGPCSIAVRLNRGDGTFGGPRVTSGGCASLLLKTAPKIVLGRVDADARLDAVVAVRDGSDYDVRVFLGNGAGGFTVTSLASLNVAALSLAVADMDRNGALDIVATDAGYVKVVLNDGSGSFVHSCADHCFPVASGDPRAVALGDVDGDGKTDVLAGDYVTSRMSVMLNRTATPSGVSTYGAGTPGCLGAITLSGNQPPEAGNADFGLTVANGPRDTPGFVAFGSKHAAGWQIKGLTIHVSGPPFVVADGFRTDAGGTGFFALPIPDDPLLVGWVVAVQGLWLPSIADGQTCTPPLLGVVSSKGLELTIQ